MARNRKLKVKDLEAVMSPALNAYILLDLCRSRGALTQDKRPNPVPEERVSLVQVEYGRRIVRQKKQTERNKK